MFTGIVETLGIIKNIEAIEGNINFTIQSTIAQDLKVDQSIAHNGICLTVVAIENNTHTVTAIYETLQKTNATFWQKNDCINLERCLTFNGRIDGHLVQGHVDCTAICNIVEEQNGSWLYTFTFDEKFAHLLIEKGSICVNGISLTCFNITKNSFTVAIIPYTYLHTSIQYVKPNTTVNIEFDVIGKYFDRYRTLKLL